MSVITDKYCMPANNIIIVNSEDQPQKLLKRCQES